MKRNRYLTDNIINDLKNKMVFVGGARQVGKTTLAKDIIAEQFNSNFYYNWDFSPDRRKIISNELPGEPSLLIFDEIHKYKKWKTLVKGIYDTFKQKHKIIVTGSARLNIFRKGGDSLQGRYHYYTLHPFTLAEVENIRNKWQPFEEINFPTSYYKSSLESLLNFGGFPEPLLSQDFKTLRRWHNEKLERLFKEDIRDVENIRDINNMKLLGDLLSSKAASLLSINNLCEDLEVSHRAVTNWLNILEAFYYIFRVYPFTSKKIRSIKKESKLYLIDWSEIEEEGSRFENMIASHLLKFVQFLYESEGYKADLFYLRNVDKKEVDFLVTINNKPWFSVETKLNDKKPSPNIIYFKERLKIPFNYQVIREENTDILKDGIRVISSSKFLSGLL